MAMDQLAHRDLLADLADERDEQLALLRDLPGEDWSIPTPSVGWDIHDQVVHLAFFDDLAAVALIDAERFGQEAADVLRAGAGWLDEISHSRRDLMPSEVLGWIERSGARLLETFEAAGPGARAPWFGPAMSAPSSATARMMEYWAHGQDIHDAVCRRRQPTDRVSHICHLGVRTRDFAFGLRGLELPDTDVRVELTSPTGRVLSWGATDAVDRVTGPAEDFALVVTQRRHVGDTGLHCTPGPAAAWMSIAQAFAGDPGPGRPAGRDRARR